ncbi:MAG: phenylacetate--CoA ligase family protein [Pseudonocardiaceae bacterium]
MADVFAQFCAVRERAIADMARCESFNRDELLSWQLEHLNAQLDHAAAESPHYRRLLAGRVTQPLDKLDDIAALPFTTKTDLRAGYPFEFLAVPRSRLCRYGESTGTTGAPTSAAITLADWIRGNVWVERALSHHFGPGDVVFIAIPYELAFASYDVDRAFETVGATVVAVGALTQVCPFERTAQMMVTAKPSGLVCTPSRALRLFDLITAQGGDPHEVGLSTLLYIGETCSAAKLDKIARLWGVGLTTAYGSTETNSLGLPCADGGLHLTEDRHLFEIIDPLTGSPLPGAGSGELVLTSLRSEAMPLIRYRTGDLVTISDQPCICGSPRRLVHHQGRVSERIVVGGVTIEKLDLEQLVLSTSGTGLYYAAGEVDGRLVVRVECVGSAAAEVCTVISNRIRAAYPVQVDVSPVPRAVIMAAMDRMLKPGSLALRDLCEVES